MQQRSEGRDPGLSKNEGIHSDGDLWSSTKQDDYDINRLGRVPQLRRNFTAFSIVGLTATTLVTYSSILTSISFIYINGGRAASIYVYIAAWVGETLVVASLAEMASMAPTSAGQFHWVSELAPPSIQRPLSYVAGWLAALTWQTYIATPAFAAAQISLILARLNNPSYTPQTWHETLLTLAIVILAFLFNVYGAKILPIAESLAMIVLFIGFLAALIPLWVLAPKVPPSEVFGSFANYGGWKSVGGACVIGQIFVTAALTGCDASAHMAEEVKDASIIVPRMMMGTVLISGLMGFVTTITLALVTQNIEEQVVNSVAVYPFLDIFQAAVGSKIGATGMAALLVPLNFFCSVSSMATASRQAWAFASANGLPFSSWLTKLTVVNSVPLPVHAMTASIGISVIISLLNLGGAEVFDSVYGLGASAASFTYLIGIASVFWRRTRGQPLPPARWSLGRFGILINVLSLLFLLQFEAIAYFPLFKDVKSKTMNWGVAMFGGAVLFSVLYYSVRGCRVYIAPVVHVRQE